jgi:NAD(P)H-hydrate epimerase
MPRFDSSNLQPVSAVPPLPQRRPDGNKGDFGKVLVVGGSRGMSGAPAMAAMAAYRSGAGLVRIAVPLAIWDIVAFKIDEGLTDGLPQTKKETLGARALPQLSKIADWCDVVVLGPGLSQEKETSETIRKFIVKLDKPLVLDADGLNAFRDGRIEKLKPSKEPNRVLTPHPGEMARLLSISIPEVQADRPGAVAECARRSGCVTILKGAGTLVCDGARLYKNTTGNPGMATGGTGDVLSGMIGALIGQGLSAFDAACLGVYLHGLAGDLAAERLGTHSLMAGDMIDELPNAFKAIRNRK